MTTRLISIFLLVLVMVSFRSFAEDVIGPKPVDPAKDLRLDVRFDRPNYGKGEDVMLEISVTNISGNAVDVMLRLNYHIKISKNGLPVPSPPPVVELRHLTNKERSAEMLRIEGSGSHFPTHLKPKEAETWRVKLNVIADLSLDGNYAVKVEIPFHMLGYPPPLSGVLQSSGTFSVGTVPIQTK